MSYLSLRDQLDIARTDRRMAREGVATALRSDTYDGIVHMLRYRTMYFDPRPGTKPHIFRQNFKGRWLWAAAFCQRGPNPNMYTDRRTHV